MESGRRRRGGGEWGKDDDGRHHTGEQSGGRSQLQGGSTDQGRIEREREKPRVRSKLMGKKQICGAEPETQSV